MARVRCLRRRNIFYIRAKQPLANIPVTPPPKRTPLRRGSNEIDVMNAC